MREIFPRLMDVQMIPNAGHMMPLEASDALNVILLDYLARINA
jgi:pimeloyl-ACP methyl ester carboxylesterase